MGIKKIEEKYELKDAETFLRGIGAFLEERTREFFMWGATSDGRWIYTSLSTASRAFVLSGEKLNVITDIENPGILIGERITGYEQLKEKLRGKKIIPFNFQGYLLLRVAEEEEE